MSTPADNLTQAERDAMVEKIVHDITNEGITPAKTIRELVKIGPTRDLNYLQLILDDPGVLAGIRDDKSPERLDVRNWNHPLNCFLHVQYDGKDAGFLAFINKGEGVVELHTCLLPNAHGQVAAEVAIQAFDWVFLTMPTTDISTFAFTSAPNVKLMARLTGFREVGRATWQNTVNGKEVQRVNYVQGIDEWASRSLARFAEGANPGTATFIPDNQGLLTLFFRMVGCGQPMKAKFFWNKHRAILDLPPAEYYGNRGGGAICSIGPMFFEIHPAGVVQLGVLQQPGEPAKEGG